ncbi:hypothetical protein [Acetobacter orientalis]|uniref:hypothetical protein n=1 Tax=Acetobacter orientalis TaxID=146474 RepID=UPI0039E8CF7D
MDIPDPSKVIKSAFLRQFATNAKIIPRHEQGLFVMDMAKHTKAKEPEFTIAARLNMRSKSGVKAWL